MDGKMSQHTDEVASALRETGTSAQQAPQSATELLPLVYEQLRMLARRKMSQERPDQTLQATALVHEAVLRLMGGEAVRRWADRWHFYAAAAEAMRRILVDAARRRKRIKRGGGMQRLNLDDVTVVVEGSEDQLLALNEALTDLALQHPEKAELVKLRYFAGLTLENAARALNISSATADRYWAYAKAWLYHHIGAPDQKQQQQQEQPGEGS